MNPPSGIKFFDGTSPSNWLYFNRGQYCAGIAPDRSQSGAIQQVKGDSFWKVSHGRWSLGREYYPKQK